MKPASIHRAVLPLVALVMMAAASPAVAQDAMSSRYAAIRAPTESLVNRIGQQRLQADLNALGRAETRLRIERRQAERLRFQDPVSGLAAAERALDSQLRRNRIDQAETATQLRDLSRDPNGPLVPMLDLIEDDGAGAVPVFAPSEIDSLTSEEAIAAARAYVDSLLRANRSRR